MIALKVTLPAEEEGAEVDEAKGVGGAVDLDRLKRNGNGIYGTHNMKVVGNKKGNRKMA